ncbi:MAG TPA: hypothetical protein VFE31_11715 [Opitutaceae bacterium]|nr:hypothetical protein [Opitutaceae bacterium]
MATDKEDDGFHAALKAALPRYPAPPELAARIQAAIEAAGAANGGRADSGPGAPPGSAPDRAPVVRMIFWPVIAAAAALVALATGYQWGRGNTQARFLDQEAVAAHIRSLQGEHLMDVVSTDQHTVKPWFAGKLDFSPPVVDLAAEGDRLEGGRLDRLGGHTVAALVYRHRQHTINLFVWPGKPSGPAKTSTDGYQTRSWSGGDFAFLAVSDAPASELEHFEQAFQNASR